MLSSTIKTHIGKLQQKKYRKDFQEFLVEGIKGVEEALQYGTVLAVIVDGARRDEPALASVIAAAEKKQVSVEFCGRKDIDVIKTTETFPGVMAIVELPESDFDTIIESNAVIVLDGVKDPGNLGTIIRTADWFGIKAIVLSEESVDPYNEKCVRSTMGSIFRVNIFRAENLLQTVEDLKEDGYKIYGLSMEGKALETLKTPSKAAYIFGSESHGIRKELIQAADGLYAIPGNTEAESLNLSVAAGIVMWKIKQ